MKILLSTPNLLPEAGGPAYSVPAIKRYLNECAHQAATMTQRKSGGDHVLADLEKNVADYDVVHNFGTWTPFNHRISSAAYRAGIPQVFCPMGMLEPWALGQKRLKKKAAWLFYQRRDIERSAVIHATSSMEARNISALGIKVPIAILPRGIDVPAELSARPDEKKIRTALFLSRLHPKKGVLELVEAWAALHPSGWRLTIAGPDGDGYGSVVLDAIERLNLKGSISMVGPVYGEEKARLYGEADLFILPTHSENFGLVIPEALSYGMPVITTTGAPWEELRETRSGLWIEPGVPTLVQALDDAVRLSSAELQAMGMRGRKLVEERYGWRALILKHIELYQWISQGGNKPDFVL